MGAPKRGAFGNRAPKHGHLVNQEKATGAVPDTCQGGLNDRMIPDTVKTARTWYPRENKQVNPELEKKVGGQMKDSVLTDIVTKTHEKFCNHKRWTLEKWTDDVKATGRELQDLRSAARLTR